MAALEWHQETIAVGGGTFIPTFELNDKWMDYG